MVFSSDNSYLLVAIKGRLPTDLNNPTGVFQPGYIASYAITGSTLASKPKKYTNPVPFGIQEDINTAGLFFLTDVSTGYSTFRPGSDEMLVQGTIPLQQAASSLLCFRSGLMSPRRHAGPRSLPLLTASTPSIRQARATSPRSPSIRPLSSESILP